MADATPKLIDMTKGHRTKAEKEYRKENEKALYIGKSFQESKQVKADPIAHAEFLRLKKLFENIAFIDALDQQIINRYCLELSNLNSMQAIVLMLNAKLENPDIETEELIKLSDAYNSTQSKLLKCKELLLKYEDRLFLSPAGRIKAIPKKPPKDETQTGGMAAFLAKKAGNQ